MDISEAINPPSSVFASLGKHHLLLHTCTGRGFIYWVQSYCKLTIEYYTVTIEYYTVTIEYYTVTILDVVLSTGCSHTVRMH